MNATHPSTTGTFVCPVCKSRQYHSVHASFPLPPSESSLYRCSQCNFGFTELAQFVKQEKKKS